MINRKQLHAIKASPSKRLLEARFSTVRKGKLPKPLDKLGGPRIKASPLCHLGQDLHAVFIWKTGEVLEQRQLYGWLFQKVDRGMLPLVRIDYHLSHKNLHMVLNCERGLDLTNRGLPGCKEFTLKDVALDPDNEGDRKHFIGLFCERLNIKLGEPGLL